MNKYERLAAKCCKGWSTERVQSFIAGAKAMDNQIKRDQYYDCERTRREYQKRIKDLKNEMVSQKIEGDDQIMNFIQRATTWMASCVGTPNAAEFKAAMENMPHDEVIYENVARRSFTCCMEVIRKYMDLDKVVCPITDGEHIIEVRTSDVIHEIQNKIIRMMRKIYGIHTKCYTLETDIR